MKVIVVGSNGRMGKFRSRLLRERGIEVIEYDIGFDEKILNQNVDGYLVATPMGSHKEILFKLIPQKCPIFVEKPLSGSKQDIEEIFDFAETYDTPIYVAWQRRMHSDYRDIKECLKNVNNDWRKIHIVSGDNPSPPSHVLNIPNYIHADFTGHDINELLWMTDGEMPESIEVYNQKVFGNQFDSSMIVCKYSNDRIAVLEGYTKNPDNYYLQTLNINTPEYTIKSKDVRDKRSFPEFYKKAFESEIDLFVDVLKGDKDFPKQREQNVKTAQLIDKIIEESNKNTKIEFLGGGNFGSYIHGIIPNAGGIHTRTKGKTFHEILDDKSIKKVYVCTPDKEHDKHAIELLQNYKAVLCEKPIEELEILIHLAEDRNLPFMIGFQRRYDIRFKEAFKRASTTDQQVIIMSHDPVPFDKDSKFVVANSLIHDFDTLNMMYPQSEFNITYVNACGSSIDIELDIVHSDDNVTNVIIRYRKEWDTYLQSVYIKFEDCMDDLFGFDYKLEDGVKVFDSYRDAYKKQFEEFSKMTGFDPELANSYRKTIKMVKDTIALL